VLNLIICAPDIESAQRASKVLRDLSSTHIARVTILILDSSDTTPSGISTWVTLRCFSVISDLMRHCFEQMTMLVTGSAIRSVGNIIQPLLKPELPVYLWWLGDPPDEASSLSPLVNLSNRIIVDSTSFFNPEQDVLTLTALSSASPNSAFSDLNWGRLTPWRQLVVQFFDSAEYRPYLDGLTTIEIEHAVAPVAMRVQTAQGDVSPNPTQALLLAGWLKARLGWTVVEDISRSLSDHDPASGTYHWNLDRLANPRATRPLVLSRSKSTKPGKANIYIRPQVQTEMRPGSICLVRLTSQLEDKRAVFTIIRENDLENVLTSVELSNETRPQRTVNLAAVYNEAQLLHDELEIMVHDYLFEQTLQEVAGLLE
jgi:glucose-6-phosphate dehydrogenase assembly protein OpcA